MSPEGNRPANLDVSRVMDPSTAASPRTAHAHNRANAERAFFQLDLMRSLQLHRRLALSIAAVGLVLGLAYYFAMAPVYLSQCLVYVQPAPPSVIQQGYANRWPYDSTTYDSYIQQQIQNVMREDVLTSALKKLGDAGKKPNESDQDALDRLRKQLDVARVGQTYQFTIGGRASNPELAAQTANAVAASYIESTAHDQKAGDEQRLTMLREERDRVQSALDADRAEQQELNKQLGVASVGGAPDHFDQDITEIRTELVKAGTEHDAAEAKFAAMGANHGTSSNAINAAADESADMDAGLVSMKTALNARKAFLISKMANLTPGNPEYKQDAAELAQINTNVDQMMKDLSNRAASHIQLQLRSELERTAGVEAQLNTQLRQLVSSATNATSKLQRASDLAADTTRMQSRYSTVDEQLHNRMLEDAAPTGAYISTPAGVPDHRAKSGRTRNALIIVMAGVFFGMIAAVVAHKADRHVYVGSDVEGVLGFGAMALLPDFAEVSEGAAEEHLLRLAAAIEHANQQGHLKSCVFTGTGSGTGVTTIVTRVRTLLEAMGRPTVYVDASGTSAEDEPGEAAAGRQGSQALVKAGGRSEQSALTNQMDDGGDGQTLVLTDASPISVSAETEYLARFANCVIVVVESGVTTRAEIRDAAATLERLNVAAVGFVLNRVGLAKADPAFRSSVDAIERHLQSQMGTAARRTKRTDAVVASNGSATIPKLTEVASSVSAVRPEAPETGVAGMRSQTESSQATSSDAASNVAASTVAASQAPAAGGAPSWMSSTGRVTTVETSVPKAWTEAWPPAGAPAASGGSGALESEARVPEWKVQPPLSFEPLNRQEAASVSAFVAPVAPKAEPLALRAGEPQLKVEAIAGPTHVDQEMQSNRTEFGSAVSPTGPVPVVNQSMWARPEGLPIPVGPELPRGDEMQTVAVAPFLPGKPLPEEDPDVPWWLSEVPGQRAEQPVPLLWEGDKKGKAGKEGLPHGPDPVEFSRHAEPSRLRPGVLPAQQAISERGSNGSGYSGTPLPQSPTRATVQDDSPERLTSRLSGLRSLLTGLGLKETHPSGGVADLEGLHRTPQDRGSATAEDVSRGPQTAATAPTSVHQTSGSGSGSREVSAQPEFLKPTATVPSHQGEDSKAGEESLVRTYQLGTEPEEPTLPSRRGQYRNL